MNDDPQREDQEKPAIGRSTLLAFVFLIFVASLCQSIVIFRLQNRVRNQGEAISLLQEQRLQSSSTKNE